MKKGLKVKSEAEILEGMIELLDAPEHWCQYSLYDDHGAYCIAGALNMAMTGTWGHGWFDAPGSLIERLNKAAMAKGFIGSYCPVVDFNNDHSTTYEDVVLLLKEVLYEVQNEERVKSF